MLTNLAKITELARVSEERMESTSRGHPAAWLTGQMLEEDTEAGACPEDRGG